MSLTPDRIQYLELRATTDCLLGILKGDTVEFYGPDAEKVAQACGLPLTFRGEELKGAPIAACGFPASLESQLDGDWLKWHLVLAAECQEAICEAGYPFAVACEGDLDDSGPELKIRVSFRPRLDRPPLRVV